jgi:hypothetical protein
VKTYSQQKAVAPESGEEVRLGPGVTRPWCSCSSPGNGKGGIKIRRSQVPFSSPFCSHIHFLSRCDSCEVCNELVKGTKEKMRVHTNIFHCKNQAYGFKGDFFPSPSCLSNPIPVNGRFNLYGIAYRDNPCGSLKCYCCQFSSRSAQAMKTHIESSHNKKRSVAIMTNVDENENHFNSSLESLAVKREQVESALGNISESTAPKPSLQLNSSRGILSPVQPPADVIYGPEPVRTSRNMANRKELWNWALSLCREIMR